MCDCGGSVATVSSSLMLKKFKNYDVLWKNARVAFSEVAVWLFSCSFCASVTCFVSGLSAAAEMALHGSGSCSLRAGEASCWTCRPNYPGVCVFVCVRLRACVSEHTKLKFYIYIYKISFIWICLILSGRNL